MKAYVNRYTEACQACQRTKVRNSKPSGTLQSLQIPEGPWQMIHYDFIVGLPKSHGYDAILTVVDRFTKMAHFIPTTEKVTAEGTAKLLLHNIWKTHGMPIEMVMDRGVQFNSRMMKALYDTLGIAPKFSMA